MIKCGDKLEGKAQCILYSKDGSKALGRFPYSKHGGEKGAKAAAHKREGQVQFFKQKHQGLLDALEAFGAPIVLKYVLDKAADHEICQEVVKSYVEKAQDEELPAEEPGGEEVEKAKKKRPSFKEIWQKKYGGSVTECAKKLKGKVTNPEAYCAYLKDKVLGTTKWRGKKEKSFDETVEEVLTYLQKDEETDDPLEGVDLAELEAWLAEEMETEPEPTPEPAPEPEPGPESTPEPEPEPEPAPEPEEMTNDFRTFLLRDHAQRRAGVLAVLNEEVGDG